MRCLSQQLKNKHIEKQRKEGLGATFVILGLICKISLHFSLVDFQSSKFINFYVTNNNLSTHVVVSELSQFSPSPVEFLLTFMAPTVSRGLNLINVQKASVVFLKPFCLFGTMCPFKKLREEITDNPIQKAPLYWYILLSGSA